MSKNKKISTAERVEVTPEIYYGSDLTGEQSWNLLDKIRNGDEYALALFESYAMSDPDTTYRIDATRNIMEKYPVHDEDSNLAFKNLSTVHHNLVSAAKFLDEKPDGLSHFNLGVNSSSNTARSHSSYSTSSFSSSFSDSKPYLGSRTNPMVSGGICTHCGMRYSCTCPYCRGDIR